MMLYTLDHHPHWAALLGVALNVPALLLVGFGLVFSLFGWDVGDGFYGSALAHPAVVLGGVVLALGLNALIVLRLRVDSNADETTLALTVLRRRANLVVLGLGLLLVGVILGYGFVENFGPVLR